ncbi:hypothetical protein D3C85_1624240 [compost metagenome]
MNIAALVYGVGAIVNMVWPRSPDAAWYINYSMILTTVVVMGAGFLYMLLAKPYDKGTAPAGDAWKFSKPAPKAAEVAGVPAQ